MVKRNIKNDKKKTNGWQSTSQKTKDWVIRTPLKNRGELMCSGMVSSDIKVTKLLIYCFVLLWYTKNPNVMIDNVCHNNMVLNVIINIIIMHF
jgi:hypothetical protein